MEERNYLKTITAGELMDTPLLPNALVVEGFLPAGTYILAGTPKIGKSFLMTQLCWCVSEGADFLGYDTRQAAVLYLALEDTNARLQRRLNTMFGVDWQGDHLHLAFRSIHMGDDLVQDLRDFVFEHPETRLIVIDTLLRARGHDNGDYNYSADYRDVLPFKEFTDAHDLALILVHHTRKNKESANPFDQISGTNGLMGAADGAFVLYREKNETFLDFVGRDLPEQRYVLRFERANCQWELLRTDIPVYEDPPEPLLDWIDALVLESWDGTATQLLEELKDIAPADFSCLPNHLTKRLNVLTGRLMDEKRIRYNCSRNRESRRLHFRRQPNE